MKSPAIKTTQKTNDNASQQSSGAENAVVFTPPDYGIEFVDNDMIATTPVQRVGKLENELPLQASSTAATTVQREQQAVVAKPNHTGLPDNLKSGIEHLSGYSMDDVKVHYNSTKPAQLQAHAYAQGSDIHLGSGQERHLPHEAWHVVQQKQGRVKPTMQMKDKVNINDDARLEKEADVMGSRVLQQIATAGDTDNQSINHSVIRDSFNQPFQLKPADFSNLSVLNIKTKYGLSKSSSHPFSNDPDYDDLKDAITAYALLLENNINGRQDQLSKVNRIKDLWINYYTNTLKPKYLGTNTIDHHAKKFAVDLLSTLIDKEYLELGAGDPLIVPTTQTLKAIRFQGDHMLEQIALGNMELTGDEVGIYVLKIQQALIDASILDSARANKKFDVNTKAAVKAFQHAETITETENVDTATMNRLDTKFRGYRYEGTIAKDQPADTTDTRVLDPHEKRAVKSEISTGAKVNVVTGQLPVFSANIVAGNYKARVKAKVEEIVESQYKAIGEGKAILHANPANLLAGGTIDNIADESKKSTDAIFGSYKTGAAMSYNVSIFDAWENKVATLTDLAEQNSAVKWRVRKIITGKRQIRTIDREHGAVQSRGPEAAILKQIINEVSADKRVKLLETHKGWPGFADNGKIYIQRFKDADDDVNRDTCWRLYRTCIHEYIHTLEHAKSVSYRSTLKEKVGGFTIREGFTDYFTKIVWGNIDFSSGTLRADVEGPFHVDDTHPIPRMGAYSEAVNAERVAGIIGIKNLYAAFFLGEVDRLKF